MSVFALDDAVSLTPGNEAGVFHIKADQRFWNMDSAFGGWQAVACAQAVRQSPSMRGQIVSQQVMFQAPVRADNLVLRVQLMEQRRTLDFWQVSLIDPEQNRILASCQLVAGERQSTTISFESPAPELRSFEESFPIPVREGMPTWFSHYEIRLAKGRPFQVNTTPRSATWVRERDGRPLDDMALLSICDTPMPRTFFCAEGATQASTIALGTHIYATEAQVKENQEAPVLLDTTARVLRDGLINQETAVYREDGLLLAMSYQTGLYRER
ncbi:MAG: thioesterase family protein [Pseudomonadota bacterium]